MIHDIDEALRELVRREALAGTEVDISFEAPTLDWAARRNAPCVDLYLYDVHEDLERRGSGLEEVRDDQDRIVARRPPDRRFKLTYLVTAWTQRAEDEHRLLSVLLACFIRFDALPHDVLTGSLAGVTMPISIALPPPDDRQPADVWSALGGQLKPGLDLVVIAPLRAETLQPAAALVLEEPRLRMERPDVTGEAGHRVRRRRQVVSGTSTVERETVQGGIDRQPGRVVRVRELTEE